MPSRYRAWFSEQQNEGNYGIVSETDFSTFESFLRGETAAEDVLRGLVTSKRTSEDQDDARYSVLGLTAQFAQYFPEHQVRLVDLIKALVADPTIDIDPFFWELRDIQDDLTLQLRSFFLDSDKQPNRETLVTLQNRWANHHAFMARCSNANTASLGKEWAIVYIEKSLEAKDDKTSEVELETNLLAAANWLAYAAPVILAACRALGQGGWKEMPAEEKLWKGSPGFSMERWAFWKKRLEELSKEEGRFEDDMVQLLRRASAAMEEAERAEGDK